MCATLDYANLFLEREDHFVPLLRLLDGSIGAGDNKQSFADLRAKVMPTLNFLTKVVKGSAEARALVKAQIFPPDRDEVWQARLIQQKQEDMLLEDEDDIATRKQERDAERMKPVDSPPGTLRQRLIVLMTTLEEHTKRLVSEFLLELCDAVSLALCPPFMNEE